MNIRFGDMKARAGIAHALSKRAGHALRFLSITTLLVGVGACATQPRESPVNEVIGPDGHPRVFDAIDACAWAERAGWTRTDLYFVTSMATAANSDNRHLEEFIDREVRSAFGPGNVAVLRAPDASVVTLFYSGESYRRAVLAIVDAYRRDFDPATIWRVDAPACAARVVPPETQRESQANA